MKKEQAREWAKAQSLRLSVDLVSAAKSQLKFLATVDRNRYLYEGPTLERAIYRYKFSLILLNNDVFLKDAMARYKGFLYLIRTNKRKNMKHFFVPTYDVDLMWHSHQLNPIPYNDDSSKLFGKVLEHDDTDSDRTKGKKLDTGFTGTSKLWEDTFGLSYWKAGTMNRGNALLQLHKLLSLIIMKNSPEGDKGELRVSFSKKQPDKLFNAKRTLTISSESEEKQVSYFQCEANGEFLFELVCHSPSDIQLPNSLKPLGSCSLSLQECLNVGSRLFVDKWIPVVPAPGILTSKPILLHVSLSFTPPTLAPQVFHLMPSQHNLNNASIFPVSSTGKVKRAKGQSVTGNNRNDFLSLQMRDLSNDITRSNPELLKEVRYVTNSGETHTLAEFKRNEWYIKGANCSSKLHKTSGNDGHLFELVGDRMVRLFAGRKLDYEPIQYQDKRSEQDFMTAIEFSTEFPYGRA
ncbi:Glycine-rich domain-containing protein 1, partial [Bienertia sinuspersici]